MANLCFRLLAGAQLGVLAALWLVILPVAMLAAGAGLAVSALRVAKPAA